MNNSISISNNQGDILGVGISGNGNFFAKEVSLNLHISANEHDSQQLREISSSPIKIEDLFALINKTKNPTTETKIKKPNRIQRAIARMYDKTQKQKQMKIKEESRQIDEFITKTTIQIGNNLIHKGEFYELLNYTIQS